MKAKRWKVVLLLISIFVAMLWRGLFAHAANEKTVFFEDENLYIQVKDSLGDKVKSFNNEEKSITVDIAEVKSINIFKNGIKNLNGLEQFENLSSLSINNGEAVSENGEDVHTVSSGKLEGLDKLKEMKMLNSLSLRYCQITNEDLKFIDGIANLKALDLSSNEITDISSMNNLTNIESLRLDNNQIEDVSCLSGCREMKNLYLNENKISDISFIAGLSNITNLGLSNNNIEDISSIAYLKNLYFFEISNNNVTNLDSIRNLRNIKNVNFSGNHITDFTPVLELVNLDLGDRYITKLGEQKIDINIKDGDIVKLPPIIKQSFKIFNVAESLDCINCTVSDDYEFCTVKPGVQAARIRICKGSLANSIITLKPADSTDDEYKLSEKEKNNVSKGVPVEKAIVSLPKNVVIILTLVIVVILFSLTVFVIVRKKDKLKL